MRESGKIVSGGEGIWRVFTDKGPVDCKDQKVAYEILKQGLTNKVQLAATNAGAENIHIQFEDEEQTAIILWHNERFFGEAQNKLTALLHEYADNETVSKAVLEMQRQNVNSLGYGIKSFTFESRKIRFKNNEGSY